MSFSFGPSADKAHHNNNIHEESFKIKSSFAGQLEQEAAKENIYTERDNREENRGFLPIEIPTRESSAAEKRKWSQVNTHKLLQQFASGNDSSSSDDEIKELCSKKSGALVLSSSPPGKVTVLSKHSAFSARVRPTTHTSDGHSRKKHRVVFAEDDGLFSRPSLNFEKMQQVKIIRPSFGRNNKFYCLIFCLLVHANVVLPVFILMIHMHAV